MVQEVIDVIGKLGPLCVAIAVYLANRAQTKWANAVSRRAADVEDQKLRLALLDRRLLAVEAVREASNSFFSRMEIPPDAIEQVRQAMLVAQTVYGDEEEAAITECLKRIHLWRLADMRVQRYMGGPDKTKENAAFHERSQRDRELIDILERLPEQLRVATKVTIVPPIPHKKTAFAKLRDLIAGR